jgi:1-acyl-sn-glycerol-3-phosphate acyltransferase
MSRIAKEPVKEGYGPIRSLLYAVLWLAGNLFFRVWLRLRIRGRPRPFPKGALVVAANHCSFIDPLILAVTVPRRVVYMVTSSVYDLPFYRPWMWLFGCIRVQDGSVNVEAMHAALDALRRGQVVGIFPEGGLADDGRLKEGQIGVASLLLLGDAPVQALAIVGTHEALPRQLKFPRPVRVEVKYSDVIRPAEVDGSLDPRARRRVLRDRVMAAIAKELPERMRPASVEAVVDREVGKSSTG